MNWKIKVQKWPSTCKKYPVGLKRQDQEITNLNQLVVSCMILMMRAYATLWLFLSVPTDPKHELRQLLWWVLQCPHIFQNIYGNFRVEGRLRPLNGLEENVASDSELPGYVNFVCAYQDIARLKTFMPFTTYPHFNAVIFSTGFQVLWKKLKLS